MPTHVISVAGTAADTAGNAPIHTPVPYVITTGASTTTINDAEYNRYGVVFIEGPENEKVTVWIGDSSLSFYLTDTYTIDGAAYVPADIQALKTKIETDLFGTDKRVAIGDTQIMVTAGDTDYANAAGEMILSKSAASFYVQDDGIQNVGSLSVAPGDTYIQGADNNGQCNLGATGRGAYATKSQEFADNAAAIAGGLQVGDFYRTGDIVKIVH